MIGKLVELLKPDDYIPQNQRFLIPKITIFSKEAHFPRPIILGIYVSFQGCNPTSEV